MGRDTWERRPDWWPSWYPMRCGGCRRPWLPRRITLSWAHCDCAGAGEARGHDVIYCAATAGCWWHVWPPEHVPGSETPERWAPAR